MAKWLKYSDFIHQCKHIHKRPIQSNFAGGKKNLLALSLVSWMKPRFAKPTFVLGGWQWQKLKGRDQILTLLLNTSLPLGNLYRASIKLFNFAVIYCSFSNSNGNRGSVYCLLSLVELDYFPSCPFTQRWHSSLRRATPGGSSNKVWQGNHYPWRSNGRLWALGLSVQVIYQSELGNDSFDQVNTIGIGAT